MIVAILAAALALQPAQPTPAADDWRAQEAKVLKNPVQLTSRDAFIKAGEAYFNHDATSIIFQAIPVPASGETEEPFYQMYVAKLKREGNTIVGIETPTRLSPKGSANTCGWFHPKFEGVVLFGSTLTKPAMNDVPGYQRTTGRYVWQFHSETQIVMAQVLTGDKNAEGFEISGNTMPQIVFQKPGYTAEASWSADGRYILYANFDRARSEKLGRNHLDILVFDAQKKEHIPLVTADGYNGGPFFSPDGKSICFRSDRKGDSLLQLFVAELKFAEDGSIVGVEREHQLTANEHVNWAPYWHPSGTFLVYASSEVSHRNYEVFAVPVDLAKLRAGQKPSEIPHQRLTFGPGADVLPAFTDDGAFMMWTAQRGPLAPGEDRPSSQLWIAGFDASGVSLPSVGK